MKRILSSIVLLAAVSIFAAACGFEHSATVLGPGTGYVPVATGDFNADGKDDFVVLNLVDGSIVMVLMDGTTVLSATPGLALTIQP